MHKSITTHPSNHKAHIQLQIIILKNHSFTRTSIPLHYHPIHRHFSVFLFFTFIPAHHVSSPSPPPFRSQCTHTSTDGDPHNRHFSPPPPRPSGPSGSTTDRHSATNSANSGSFINLPTSLPGSHALLSLVRSWRRCGLLSCSFSNGLSPVTHNNNFIYHINSNLSHTLFTLRSCSHVHVC